MQVWIENRHTFDFEGRRRPRWDVVTRDGRSVASDGLAASALAARDWARSRGYVLAAGARPGAPVPAPDSLDPDELVRRRRVYAGLVLRHPVGDTPAAGWLNEQLRERGFTWGFAVIGDRIETFG